MVWKTHRYLPENVESAQSVCNQPWVKHLSSHLSYKSLPVETFPVSVFIWTLIFFRWDEDPRWILQWGFGPEQRPAVPLAPAAGSRPVRHRFGQLPGGTPQWAGQHCGQPHWRGQQVQSIHTWTYINKSNREQKTNLQFNDAKFCITNVALLLYLKYLWVTDTVLWHCTDFVTRERVHLWAFFIIIHIRSDYRSVCYHQVQTTCCVIWCV